MQKGKSGRRGRLYLNIPFVFTNCLYRWHSFCTPLHWINLLTISITVNIFYSSYNCYARGYPCTLHASNLPLPQSLPTLHASVNTVQLISPMATTYCLTTFSSYCLIHTFFVKYIILQSYRDTLFTHVFCLVKNIVFHIN